MEYRPATVHDWPAITEYIGGKEYFSPTDPSQLGGYWIIAVEDEKICGTIWAFAQAPNAYIDSWAADSPHIAAHLGAYMYHDLEQAGIKYVRAIIASTNSSAKRMAAKFFGMGIADNYSLAFRRI